MTVNFLFNLRSSVAKAASAPLPLTSSTNPSGHLCYFQFFFIRKVRKTTSIRRKTIDNKRIIAKFEVMFRKTRHWPSFCKFNELRVIIRIYYSHFKILTKKLFKKKHWRTFSCIIHYNAYLMKINPSHVGTSR